MTPCACSVAAVASMIASAIRFENAMPNRVSKRIRRYCRRAALGTSLSGRWRVVATSSASCELCQKNRYGLMVVPNTATTVSSGTLAEVGRPKIPRSACAPIDVHQQDDAHISEQAERQPFQDMRILAVRNEDLQHDAEQGEDNHEDMLLPPPTSWRGGGHRAEVGADVEDIGDEKDVTSSETTGCGKMRDEVPRETARPVTRPICALTSCTAAISG